MVFSNSALVIDTTVHVKLGNRTLHAIIA